MKSYLTAAIILLLTFSTITSSAANYYFSSSSGDDSRTSAQAQNVNTPWRSLAKLNAIFTGLNAGDSVLFRCGESFFGSITVIKSGTTGRPIVFSSYGSGQKPVINGFLGLNDWVPVGNGIWESIAQISNSRINMLVINGVQYAMGRFPNANAANNGYLTYESHNANTQITDNELSSAPNWTGSEVVIRKVRGVFDKCAVLAHSGGTISYQSPTVYNASDGFGYFFQNDIKTLDQYGEWYYNASQKRMLVYFGSSAPPPNTVFASSVNNLVFMTSQSNIVLSNIAFQGANTDAIRVNAAQGVVVNACDVSFSGESGIKTSVTSGLKIENSSFQNSNNTGIDLAYNNEYGVVRNNNIQNTALFPGMSTSGDGNSSGINARGAGNLIESNTVLNTGYNGISFTENDVVIKNNYINTFCLTKDDGGGIYTVTGNINILHSGRKIIGNTIINGVGAGAGTNDINYLPVNGIYMDDNASGIEVVYNSVANMPNFSVFFHGAHDIKMKYNTFFNGKVQLYMRSYEDPYASVRNNEIVGNIFASKQAIQPLMQLVSIRKDIEQFARMDSNYYVRPADDNMTILNDYIYNFGSNTKTDAYDLDGWKAKYGKDAASKKSPTQFPSYIVNSVSSANKFANASFLSDIGYINCYTQSGNCNTSWVNNKLDGGALQVSFSSPISSDNVSVISIPVGAISSSKRYLAKFSLQGSISGKSVSVYLRSNDTYNKLAPSQYVKIPVTRSENELLISFPANAGNAGLIFEVNDQYNTYWLDNISLTEVTATIANPDDIIRFEFNPGSVPKSIFLSNSYVDVNNVGYAGNVTLQPYTSLLLFRKETGKANQTISFPAISSKILGSGNFSLNATASSGLPISYRIVSGPATVNGEVLSMTGAGTVVVEASQLGNTSYNAAPSVNVTFAITSATICSASGTILREQWNNIGGWAISSIPLQTTPQVTSQLSTFESRDAGQLYGARIRGYVCAPQTGNYTFYVSGDDVLELWLSTDDNAANKVKVCNTNYTMFREWNKYPSQKSVPINLEMGKRYYVEVLQKEGGGGGHSSVGWQLPNGVFEGPIPGSQLSPFSLNVQVKSSQSITFPSIATKIFGSPSFSLNAVASSNLPVSYRIVSGPAQLNNDVLTLSGAGSVVVEASQSGNETFNAAPPVTQSFTVTAATGCTASGTILREQWNNISGWSVSSIPLQTTPSSTSQLNSFESRDIGELYGARIRGFICPPQSGNYTFFISGDDVLELWMSTDDNPANKVKLCNTNYTMFREWNKYPSQKSGTINLQQGRRYYIEVLQKEGGGGGHSSVGWVLPNGVFEGPISGTQLSPFVGSASALAAASHSEGVIVVTGNHAQDTKSNVQVIATFPNPFKSFVNIHVTPSLSGQATLNVLDNYGQLVQKVFTGTLEKNISKRFVFNADKLSPGGYHLQLLIQGQRFDKKIMLIR